MSSLGVNATPKAFSQRLLKQLQSHRKSLSPTTLSREFNLRWRGAPVSPNAARKWLLGESIPTMDKIEVLANMLGTNSEWLRWGETPMANYQTTVSTTDFLKDVSFEPNLERSVIQDYRLLNRQNQRVVFHLMEIMLREQKSNMT
jgi:hypothetical protein